MKFCTISDVHIKNPDDCPNHRLFLNFLNSKEVTDSDKIFLLGDIFDIMVGNHYEYIESYHSIFSRLIDLSASGKEIYYIEGNHDFHIKALIESFIKKNNLINFRAFKMPIKLRDESQDKLIYLGHGDEIEIENPSYKIFSFFMRSFIMKFIADKIFTYNFVISLGQWASRKSRNRNEKKYTRAFNESSIKEKFQKSAEIEHSRSPFDLMICGHSHVKDDYDSVNNFKYINNGYFPIEKSFIYYDEGETRFISLES